MIMRIILNNMPSDFELRYDPATEKKEELAYKLVQWMFNRKQHKDVPVVCYFIAKSSMGKSYGMLKFAKIILAGEGINYGDYIEVFNVFTPLEYNKKIRELRENKEYKKITVLLIHDARILIHAHNWHSFVNQTIADNIALGRKVKNIILIIGSQSWKEIDKNIRHMADYAIEVDRNLTKNYVNLKWSKISLDTRDLENPKVRRFPIRGRVHYPSGRCRWWRPSHLKLSNIKTETPEDWQYVKKFDALDTEAKRKVLDAKNKAMEKQLRAEMGDMARVPELVNHYMKHKEQLTSIGKLRKKSFSISTSFRDLHDLSRDEVKEFQKELFRRLTGEGILGDVPAEEQSKD